ncbi:MAG: hypothetical protein LZF62_30009 [Nitrospira sp.]|nr:MAG: hypothetical protein LZF62_30009 [Nitrospira sp.]
MRSSSAITGRIEPKCSMYVFESLAQVREISVEWLQSYNEERPHDALAGLPPTTYRARLEARSSPVTVSC